MTDKIHTDRLTPAALRRVAPDVLRRTTVGDMESIDEFKQNVAWLSASEALVEEVVQSEGWRLELAVPRSVAPAAVRYFPDPCFMVGPGTRAIVGALQRDNPDHARSFHREPALFDVLETLMLCQDVAPDGAYERVRSLRRVWGFFARWSRPMAAPPIPYIVSRTGADLVRSYLRETSEWCYSPTLRAARSRASTIARWQFDMEMRAYHWRRFKVPAPFLDEDPHDPIGVLRLKELTNDPEVLLLSEDARRALAESGVRNVVHPDADPNPPTRQPSIRDRAPHSLRRQAGHPPTNVTDETDAAPLDRPDETTIRRMLSQRSRQDNSEAGDTHT